MKAVITANLASNILSRKNLLLAIKARGWDIVATGCADHGLEGLAELGIGFRPIPMENKGTDLIADFKTFRAFYALYKELSPDAVLHFNSKPDIYGSMAAGLLGIPSVSNVTGLGTVYVGPGGAVRKIVDALYRLAFLGRRNFVFFQNSDDRALFIESGIVSEKKTGLLPGSGVDVTRFVPRPNETSGDGTVRFLFASRLVLAKGVREFVKAAEIVKKVRPEARFEIIGELLDFRSFIPRGELEEAVSSGAVEYGGNLREVEERVADADCVVLPSYYREGVPRILLEGAAMGKPLIAADSVGTREPVEDGKNGFLCAPGSIEALAEKMMVFLALDPVERSRMGAESRKIAEERFSDALISEAYLQILNGGLRK